MKQERRTAWKVGWKVICKNCGEYFAFHGATPPHNCPITESHTEKTNFAPERERHQK